MSMLRTILNFGAGLAGGRIQLALWAAVVIAGGLYVANHQRIVKEHAMLEQRNEDLKREKERAEADYAAALESLEVEREKLSLLKDAQAKQRAELSAIHGQISAALSQGLGDIATKGQSLETETRSIPASELDGRIRAAISRARQSDAELARIRAAH